MYVSVRPTPVQFRLTAPAATVRQRPASEDGRGRCQTQGVAGGAALVAA